MDIVERLRGLFSNSYGQDEIERAIDILEDAIDEIERLRDELKFADEIRQSALQSLFAVEKENKRLRELSQNKTMQGRLDGRTVILHQSGDVWVPHWQEDPEVQGEE